MTFQAQAVEAGQAAYTPGLLKYYDLIVLRLSNPLLWRCPTPKLRALYERNLSSRHLDIGVGTGYFLDRCRFPVEEPAITLLDLNENSLAHAARRIARYRPAIVAADVLERLPSIGRFDSVGLCYLLHCLPGSIPEKALVFDNIAPALAPGARVFGATIVQGDAPRSRLAQKLMDFYNEKGIFSNVKDTEADLRSVLEECFGDFRLERHGCVLLFEARAPS